MKNYIEKFEESDMLNDKGLDEMQKTYAYKLAFKCFKAIYWCNMAFCMVPMVFMYVTNNSTIFAMVFMAMIIVTNIIYVIFGAEASKVGALSTGFNQYITKSSTIISLIGLFIVYTAMVFSKIEDRGIMVGIYYEVYMLTLVVSHVALGYIVKRNNKLIEREAEE